MSNKKTDKERVAIITGGASGIGAAIAAALAKKSWQVIIADNNQSLGSTFAESIGAEFQLVDLSQGSDCRSLVGYSIERFARLDAVVNNAGFQTVAPVDEFPEDKWNSMLAVMLTAPFLLTKYAWPHMQRQQWGRIINMASIHSMIASPNKAAYVAAKHGLIGLTRTTALEGGQHGITVNAISPAYVRTPLVENQIADQAKLNNISEDEVVDTVLLKNAAVKRLVEPEEVAKIALLLCSDEGASITGANWSIDGGWTAQ
ncbi:MAG: 3-hydroxybutyrate dehydrogenase [Arenicella sp.]